MVSRFLEDARAAGLQIASLTVEQFHRMIALGILPEGAPIELLDGALVCRDRAAAGGDIMTVGPSHSLAVKRLQRLATRVESLGCHLYCQGPVTLAENEEPEPDGVIARGTPEDYARRHPGPSADAEQREALEWYKEKVNNLAGLRVEKTLATGEGGWEGRITPEGKVESITGRHFSIEGRKISSSNLGWNQPMIVQRSEEFTDSKGEAGRVSGMVLLLRDSNDRVFVSVAEEPGIKAQMIEGKEVHPIVRTPFQTSVEKLQQLSAGNEKVDPTLHGVLGALKGHRDLSSVISDIEWRPVDTDGNRIESHVLYGTLMLNQEAAKIVAERNPSGKFLSRHQLKVLPLNGHLHIALSVTS